MPKSINMKNEDQLFMWIYLIIALKGFLNTSYLFFLIPIAQYIDTFLMMVGVSLAIVKLYTQYFKLSHFLGWLCFGCYCIITTINMHDTYMLFTFLLLMCSKDVNIKYAIRKKMIVIGCLLFIHIFIYVCVYYYDASLVPTTTRYGETNVRYGFYMLHPNSFAMYLLWTSLEWLYLHWEDLRWETLSAVYAINVMGYYFTDSRTAIIVLTFIYLILFILYKKLESQKMENLLRVIAKYGFAICSFLYASSAFLYVRASGFLLKILTGINYFLNGRLLLTAYIADVYGISLLGQNVAGYEKINWNSYWFDVIYLDSAYNALVFGYGILYTIVLSYLFYVTAKKAKIKELIFIDSYIIYCIMENYGLNAANSFILLFLGAVLFKNDKLTKNM